MVRKNTMKDEVTVSVAECAVRMAGRGMLLCHKHTFALVELADGNGVELEIALLTAESEEPCGACWAAAEAGYPRIILPD
jgi:hypothetical protein